MPFVDAHADLMPDQTGGHRVAVLQYPDQPSLADWHLLLTPHDQGRLGQGLHHGQLLRQPFLSPLVALIHDVSQEVLVVLYAVEITAAPQQQVLFHGSLQTTV